MNAETFNQYTVQQIHKKAAALGFIKSGIHYYKHVPPNVMVLHKTTHRGNFMGFHLAFTHDFMSIPKTNSGTYKIPAALENYPVSISLDQLKEQFARYNKPDQFSYDLNFMSREIYPKRRMRPNLNARIDFEKRMQSEKESKKYIDAAIDTILAEGMWFFKDFSPTLSYLAVTRHAIEDQKMQQLKNMLENYFQQQQLELPVRKKAIFRKITAYLTRKF